MEKKNKSKQRRHSKMESEVPVNVEHLEDHMAEKKKHGSKRKHQKAAEETEVPQGDLKTKSIKQKFCGKEHGSSSPNQSGTKKKIKITKQKKGEDPELEATSNKEDVLKQVDMEPAKERNQTVASESGMHVTGKKRKKCRTDVEEKETVLKRIKSSSQESESGDSNSDSTLDPEKVEMKRQKRERMKQKKDAKQKQKLLAQSGNAADITSTAALQYLQKWDSDRSNWRFQTVRQVWLLKHMYNVDDVSDEDFSILLKYLEGLKGLGRKETSEKAEELLKSHEKALAEDSDYQSEEDDNSQTREGSGEKGKKLTDLQISRVRQVLQLIS